MSSSKKLNVILDAAFLPRTHGGVATATLGLIDALGKLDGPEVYHVAVENEEQLAWVAPHIGENQRLADKLAWLKATRPGSSPGPVGRLLKKINAPIGRVVRRFHRRLHGETPPWPPVEVSDGFYESLGCDVIHFTWQKFTLSALPSIYTPHDLQHLHYPQFFSPAELAQRESMFPVGCRIAHTVIAGTQWIKDDIIRQYSTNPDKIQIIPWASPSLAFAPPAADELAAVKTKYKLETPFALFPAAAWPHKNHLRLIEAIARLRDRDGVIVRLICTGSIANTFSVYHYPKIEQRIRELNLGEQVRFLGFLPDGDMRALYQLAQFLVMPSLFEADSCPIHEAWIEGVPVASSNHTALPDQVGDAGLLFDAEDVSAIADSVRRIATDASLRQALIARGRTRVSDFDWTRTAKAYRAVYRRSARLTLDEEDRWLLQWDWMREPRKIPPSTLAKPA